VGLVAVGVGESGGGAVCAAGGGGAVAVSGAGRGGRVVGVFAERVYRYVEFCHWSGGGRRCIGIDLGRGGLNYVHWIGANYSAEESLLVLRGLGIQTSTSSASYLSTATTRFVPTTQIQDMYIYEAFKGFEVRFYLAIVVEGEGGVVVVFPVSVGRQSPAHMTTAHAL
jgi:hypothetical protein